MSQDVQQKNKNELDDTPGMGIGGRVICPILSIAGRDCECRKNGCEFWVPMTTTTKDGPVKVGRCAVAWTPLIMTEITGQLQRLNNGLEKSKSKR